MIITTLNRSLDALWYGDECRDIREREKRLFLEFMDEAESCNTFEEARHLAARNRETLDSSFWGLKERYT